MCFSEAAHEFFFLCILNETTLYTNLSRLYQVLNNGQFHIRATNEFVAQHPDVYKQHTSYVETCKRIATKFDHTITTQPMLSVGIKHTDALRICRKIAKTHGVDFSLNTYDPTASVTASICALEEGEVEDDVSSNIKKMQSNTFLLDAFSYVHVATVSE